MRNSINLYFSNNFGIKENAVAIKKAGFDGVMLSLDDLVESFDEIILTVKKEGLYIENAHLPFTGCNSLWTNEDFSVHYVALIKNYIRQCGDYGIGKVIFHLTTTDSPPPINNLGLSRLEDIIKTCEKCGVILAIENVRRPDYLDKCFEVFSSPFMKVCFDAGHNNCFTPQRDILTEYSNKIACVHLHDNFGNSDEHNLPGTGTVNWESTMTKIANSSYAGGTGLELKPLNLDSTHKTHEDFCRFAFEKSIVLAELYEKARINSQK